MRKTWFVTMALLVVFVCISSCHVGLDKPSRERVEEVQRQINELNENFKGMKATTEELNENLKKLQTVLERLADAMESLNQIAQDAFKIKNLLAP